MGFRKPKYAIGLDLGSHAVKAVLMSKSGGRMRIEYAAQFLVNRDQVNNDPIGAQAQAVREALRGMPVGKSYVVGALPGQSVVIRYPRITGKIKDQLSDVVLREAKSNVPYDLNEVYMDWTVLEEIKGDTQNQLKILLVAAKQDVVRNLLQVFQVAEVSCSALTVDTLALADAAEACDFLRVGETVAVLNIGASATSLHFIKDGVSNFVREINWGVKDLVQAIAKDRRCAYDTALRQLEEFASVPVHDAQTVADDLPEAVELPEDGMLDTKTLVPSSEEKDQWNNASLLDPLDEELDSVLPGGGASLMQGGGSSFSAPKPEIERASAFDPASLSSGGVSGLGIQRPLEEVLQGPLERMIVEVRRSFDFYEHHLYEQPVNRIILTGGIAGFPLLRVLIQDDLGIDDVETAKPDMSALVMGSDAHVGDLLQNPPQFMVAIGLAARGMADL